MKQTVFPCRPKSAYGVIAKHLRLVILFGFLSGCLMTKQPVFEPVDYVPIKGLEGAYRAEKDSVRIDALGDGRYRITGTNARSGKNANKDNIDVGFVPLRNNFYIGAFTVVQAKNNKQNYYLLTATEKATIQFWYFWPNPKFRENSNFKSSLARNELTVDNEGLISGPNNAVPSRKSLKAFFSDIVGDSTHAADWQKSGFTPLSKLLKQR